MTSIRNTVRLIARACDHAAGWLLLAIVVINLAAVFMRYVMRDSISWSEEGIRYISVWMTFSGAVAASWLDEHMDMNLFAGYGGRWFQALHKASLQILTAAFCAVLTWQGVIYVWLNGSQTAPTTGLPMVYIYSAIALGGLLLLLVSLVKIYDSFVPPGDAPDSESKKAVF